MTEYKFKVSDMRCSACVSAVERAVKKVNGVKECKVLLADKSVIVYYENVTIDEIKNAVKKAGYTPKEEKKERKLLKIVISAGILAVMMFLMFGEMLSFLPNKFNAYAYPIISCVLCLAVIFINFHYYTDGFKKLVKLHPNMSSLVAVGSIASFIYATVSMFIGFFAKNQEIREKYMKNMFFDSSAMIVVIVSIGKYLEERAIGKTRNAISELLALTPDEARLKTDDGEKTVKVDTLKIGDVIILKSGDRISADGEIVKGEIYADQSAITGESVPVSLKEGNIARGGTIVTGGYAEVRITALGENTTIGRIVKLVSEAGADKVPIAHLADKVAGIFVPTVFLIALITFIVWYFACSVEQAFNYGISVLVVSCPCALGLATPLAVMTATGVGATKNILIKNGASLEYLSKVKTAFFDKTGTITEGKFQVVEYYYAEEDILSEIASLEKNSSHPIASAICEYAEKQGKILCEAENFTSDTSKGVSGVVNGKSYKIGKSDYVSVASGEIYEKYASLHGSGVTALIVTQDGVAKAVIALSDKIRDGAENLMQKLKEENIATVMLTGDNQSTAERVASSCGISSYKANMMPEEKADEVKKATSEAPTVFVGDGVNDAVAMTMATVGVAVGSGTDVAIESADVIITSSDPSDLYSAIKLSKATVRNIKQNLFWAFFYNVIAIPVACGAFAWASIAFSPMIASVCMSLSSICVVLNALRLRKLKTR